MNFVNTIDFGDYSNEFKANLQEALELYKGLKEIRDKVDAFSIKTTKAISYYTNMNGKFLDNIVMIARLSDNAKITKELTAYSSFLLAKERAGIERAVGSAILAADKFQKGAREKFSSLISEQNSYIKTFKYYADSDSISYFNKTVNGKDIDEVNRIRKIILNAKEIGGFGVSGTYWFDTITSKINLLKKVENYIRDNLNITNKKVKDAVMVATTLSNLLHETQKERGATAGFIGSKGKKFVTKLPNQRSLTDKKLNNFLDVLKNFDVAKYPISLRNNAKKVLSYLDKLPDIRKKVTNLTIGGKEAISFYTNMNASFLDFIKTVSRMGSDVNEFKDLNAFYNFLMSKERAGIERAVGSNTFARNRFLPGMKSKWVRLVVEQDTFLKSFMASARLKFINFYKNTLKGKVVDEVNRMRKIALSTNEIGGFGVDASYWFAQMTSKINKLKKVDDYLADKLLKNIDEIEAKVNNSTIFIAIVSLVALVVTIMMSIQIVKVLQESFDSFKEGLYQFLKYSIRETDTVREIEVIGNDEFAQMAKDINVQIQKVKVILEEDNNAVKEIDDIMGKIANGFYGYTIKQTGASEEVKKLRDNINTMARDAKRKFDTINKYLENYAIGNFTYKANEEDLKGMYGDFGNLLSLVVLLGQNMSELFAQLANSGDILTKNTGILTQASEQLATSSNAQAASVEETAAAIEEISSNIINTTQNVKQMHILADNVNKSAIEGEKLASQTAQSMDEINEKVTSISEAIKVIDQIAFQTNILSLNAAVEAATAGEAGKGFAVVAGEVRNLAARSAEAANEIKKLVEEATVTTNNGKDISDNMIKGYIELKEQISKNKEMIEKVFTASQEQENAIKQINDTVNLIDKNTQANANEASNIANLVNQISSLASDFIQVASSAKFDETIKSAVCDVKMNQELLHRKHDHIVFLSESLADVDSFQTKMVKTAHECDLGHWITNSERENKSYTQTHIWQEFKKYHEEFHETVQEYIEQNASRASNYELRLIAEKIYTTLQRIFSDIDKIKLEYCSKEG